MTINEILSQLGESGIKIWLDDDLQLRFKAPKGALTDTLKSAIIDNKQAIIDFLYNSKNTKKRSIISTIRNEASIYPLSLAQRRFWFLERLQGGNASLHIAGNIKLTGNINLAQLEECFSLLIHKHETLRTSIFLDTDNEPWQKIYPPFTFRFDNVIDLSALNEHERNYRLTDIIKDESIKPFDFTAHSLLRSSIIKLDTNSHDYILTITLHHMIADGLSLPLLIKDISDFYQLLTSNTSVSIADLPLQYIDYSQWQHHWISSEDCQRQLTYWETKLEGHTLLDLMCDKTRSANHTQNGSLFTFTLPTEACALIKQSASKNNTTAYTILLAAFATLLSRYTQQSDICIGTPVAGRQHIETEAMIGCFINLLTLRIQLSNNANFHDVIRHSNDILLEALANQDIPFELVAEKCVKERSLSHSPLFQVLFSYTTNSIHPSYTINDLSIELLEQPSYTAKYDLQLHINESGDSFNAYIEYNTDLFNNDTIERLANHFSTLLTNALYEPLKPICYLPFLTEREITQQLDFSNGLNATSVDYPFAHSIHELFQQQALLSPLAIAISDSHAKISYEQLNSRANQLAHYLLEHNPQSTPIAIKLERSINMSIALFAILKAGVSYIPIATDIPNERLQFILKDTQSNIIITDNALTLTLENILSIDINDSLWLTHPNHNPDVCLAENALFNIIYTSGSTGNPKGVMVSHQGIINRLRWMQHQYPLQSNDKVLQKTPYNFDVSVWELFWPLLYGAQLYFAEPNGHKDTHYLRDIIIQENISILHFVPSMLALFLEARDLGACRTIKRVFTSGEALKIEHNNAFFKHLPFAELHNLYGPTEASIDVSFYPCRANETHRSIPIGKAIHNIQLHILDQHLQLTPQGCAGELYIGGIGLAEGYVGLNELTQKTFIDNPFLAFGHPSKRLYKTGDMVRLLDDGNIEYLGRNDHQVKIRGFRIELGEIEAQLLKLAEIKDAIVIDRQINQQTQLVAYLVCHHQTSNDHLLNQLKIHLPEYMLPSIFHFLDSLPLSSNGKVDRKQLPIVSTHITPSVEFSLPRNSMEEHMLALWQDILQVNEISIFDNFFTLGGQSLLALKLLAKIETHFNKQLNVKLIFDYPSIASFCDFIQSTSVNHFKPLNSLIIADRSKPIPLSFAQERIWIIEQMSPGSCAYHIPFALHIKGEIDTAALEYSLRQLIERHEALRTNIHTHDDGMAYQHINTADLFTLEQHQSPSLPDAKPIIEKINQTPFDFSHDLLFRAALIQIHLDEHILAMCIHHLIGDAWSLSILQNELQSLYNQYPSTNKLQAITYQYADFSASQRQASEQHNAQLHLDYWLKELEHTPPCIELPFDRPRPAQQTFNGSLSKLLVEPDINEALKQYCRQHQTTPFTVLLGAFALLLHKYSRQNDICIGTPVSGREHPSLHNIIGYFVNAVIIRQRFTSNTTVKELIDSLHSTSSNAFTHQSVAIEKVLDSLTLERNTSYSPIAQVGFSYIDKGFNQTTELNNASTTLYSTDTVIAKYELTLIAIESADGLALSFEYNTDLFNIDTIITLQEHFTSILHQCLVSPLLHLSDISLLSHEQLKYAVNADETIESVLPLSPMQYDMVMSQWIRPNTLSNTLGYRAEVDFAVDPSLWKKAVQLIADTQSIPRTQFRMSRLPYGDIAYQCILKTIDVELEIIDLRNAHAAKLDIQTAIDEFIYQPQAYQAQKFIRYGLLQLPNDKTILLLSSHHGLLDGISIVLIAEATARQYESLSSHNLAAPIELNNQFSHSIKQSQSLIDSSAVYNFWQPKLNECAPLNFSGSTSTTFKQEIKTHHIDNTLWLDIKRYSRKNKTTPALFLKTIYAYLIAQYCQASDNFFISEFHAGRDSTTANALGCFFTQSPFIVDISLINKDANIDHLLSYSRDFRKNIKPYDAISTGLTYSLAPASTLHFMFNYYHFFPQNQTLLGHPIVCIETPPFIDNTVQLVIKEKADYCELDLYYPSTHFNDLDFLQRLESLCCQMINGATSITQLDLLLPYEHDRIAAINNTDHPLPAFNHLCHWLDHQAALTPNAIAIVDETSSISYKDLNKRANQLAHYLLSSKIQENEAIGVCMDKNIDAICAIIAVIKSGAAYVPIDSQYPAARIKHMLSQANINRLFTQQHYQALFSDLDLDCLVLDDDFSIISQQAHQQATHNPTITLSADNPLYIIFTSGSTGQPKGACVSHAGELNLLHWYVNTFDFNEQSSTLIISALGFDLSQKNIFAPLVSGGKLILTHMPHYDSDHVLDTIKNHAISHLNCAPSAFYPLIEQSDNFNFLSSLQYVIVGGESINTQLFSEWLSHSSCHAKLINNYGPTECTDISLFHSNHNTEINKAIIPLGKPNYNVQCYIVNNQIQLLPIGIKGEIAVAGYGVGLGYIHNPELTDSRFIANPFTDGKLYLTGDIGSIDNNDDFIFHYRQDHQVKINGIRIELGEVEFALKQAFNIIDALAIANDNVLLAYIISDDAALPSDWKNRLAELLPTHMIPANIGLLASWPLTPNGKIDRKALPVISKTSSHVEFIAPRNDTEKVICDIVQKILSVERVGVLDNFFDLGGHSLAASRAIVQIREHFKIDIPLSILFEMTTVEKLAAYIQATQWINESANSSNDETNRDTGFI